MLNNMKNTEEELEKAVWKLSLPYLKQGRRKDFVIHTKGVIKAAKLLMKKEAGNKQLVVLAAILHDTGWSKIPIEKQLSNKPEDKLLALHLHIKTALPIAKEILTKCKLSRTDIKQICAMIFAHKFQNPRDINKRLLIDADTLSDIFKKQFYCDAFSYGVSPEKMLEIRGQNVFYTETAKKIFEKEFKKRELEILKK